MYLTSNDKYYKDEQGQWWYTHSKGRQRAISINCTKCGKNIIRLATKCKEGSKHFCSAICAENREDVVIVEKRGKYFKDQNGEWWKNSINSGGKGRIKALVFKCTNCNNMFLRLACEISNPDKVYCSYKCKNTHSNGMKGISPDKHPSWKGGKRKASGGYVYIFSPEHPDAGEKQCVLEHRLVMEQHIGRYLTNEETVHHKNGIRNDNRIENLELWNSRHPKGQRITDLVEWARSILKEYGELEDKLKITEKEVTLI